MNRIKSKEEGGEKQNHWKVSMQREGQIDGQDRKQLLMKMPKLVSSGSQISWLWIESNERNRPSWILTLTGSHGLGEWFVLYDETRTTF